MDYIRAKINVNLSPICSAHKSTNHKFSTTTTKKLTHNQNRHQFTKTKHTQTSASNIKIIRTACELKEEEEERKKERKKAFWTGCDVIQKSVNRRHGCQAYRK